MWPIGWCWYFPLKKKTPAKIPTKYPVIFPYKQPHMKEMFFSITNHPIRSSLWKPNGLKPKPMKPMRLWAWSKIWVVLIPQNGWWKKWWFQTLWTNGWFGGVLTPLFSETPIWKKNTKVTSGIVLMRSVLCGFSKASLVGFKCLGVFWARINPHEHDHATCNACNKGSCMVFTTHYEIRVDDWVMAIPNHPSRVVSSTRNPTFDHEASTNGLVEIEEPQGPPVQVSNPPCQGTACSALSKRLQEMHSSRLKPCSNGRLVKVFFKEGIHWPSLA